MSDGNVFTQVTQESFGDRLKGSCCGLVFGPLLIFGAIAMLIWNEGNAISTHKSLDQGEKITIGLTNISVINPAYEGKLVHLIGPAATNASIVDSTFGVTSANILRLHRTVEMYQWVESSSSTSTTSATGTTTTTTTYTYAKQWSTSLIPSSSFKNMTGHENPASMPYTEDKFTADPITLGAFTLPGIIIDRFSWWSPFTGNMSADTISDATLRNKTKVVQGQLYIGNDPTNATVGDMRISYEKLDSSTVSIVAQQTSNTFTAYTAKAGKPVLLVEQGTHSKEEMYQTAQDSATALAWILRLVGTLMVYLGLILLMSPLLTLVDIVPFLGDMIQGATHCIMIPVAFVISITVVSLAWLAYRPAITVPILLVCGGAVYYCYYRKQQEKNDREGVETRDDVQVEEIEDDAVMQAIALGEKDGRV